MKFDKKVGKSPSRFRNIDKYIEAVYEKNKSFIQEKMGAIAGSDYNTYSEDQKRSKFVERVKAEMTSRDVNAKKALDFLANTNTFTTQAERGHHNVFEVIKKHGMSRELLDMTKTKQKRWQKFDPNELVWDSKEKYYIYRNMVIIDISNSPEKVEIRAL